MFGNKVLFLRCKPFSLVICCAQEYYCFILHLETVLWIKSFRLHLLCNACSPAHAPMCFSLLCDACVVLVSTYTIFFLFLTLFFKLFLKLTLFIFFSKLTLLDAPVCTAQLIHSTAPCMAAQQGAVNGCGDH